MDHAQFHRVTVLGTGPVGSAIVADLAKDANLTVTAVDANPAALERLAASAGVRTQAADLRAPGAIAGLVADADLVVLAVPGFMGFESLRQVLEAGKPVVDNSPSEDAFLLNDLAKAKGLTAVVDCGVAPGMANIVAGYVESQLDQLNS